MLFNKCISLNMVLWFMGLVNRRVIKLSSKRLCRYWSRTQQPGKSSGENQVQRVNMSVKDVLMVAKDF